MIVFVVNSGCDWEMLYPSMAVVLGKPFFLLQGVKISKYRQNGLLGLGYWKCHWPCRKNGPLDSVCNLLHLNVVK